jgi:1-acyl-sn-glycerol-3-phosphate acyltransferase
MQDCNEVYFVCAVFVLCCLEPTIYNSLTHRHQPSYTSGKDMHLSDQTLPYPRRKLQRALLRGIGRGLMPLLTRTSVSGRDHFPQQGPLIVVGNHVAAMEVVLMVVFAPWQMELLGPGDIPPPPLMNAIALAHGYIPINRGNMDRTALNQALGILKQGGILGMFPEGGIWDAGEKPAKRGVAWLSYHSQAPILPIGFGGLEGAMNAALRLKRPCLSMNVGQVLPPVNIPSGVSRKDGMHAAAQQVMQAVNALIPVPYKSTAEHMIDETFNLQIEAAGSQGQAVRIPPILAITHSDALCKMWYRPAILRIFQNDLHLDVSALQHLEARPSPAAILQALGRIQDYLRRDNPAFFTYRFGMQQGRAIESGLEELAVLARWAAAENCTLCLQPTRRYRFAGQNEEIIENNPGEAHIW